MQRQMAIKMATIFIIGLALLIPINMVAGKIYERQNYLEEARLAVSRSWTGAQTLTTPVMVFPYHLSSVNMTGFYSDKNMPELEKTSLLTPVMLNTEINIENSRRLKGIYQVPVYTSAITASAEFSRQKIHAHLDAIRALPDFERFGTPYISVYLADVRGITGVPQVSIDQLSDSLEPGSLLSSLDSGLHYKFPSALTSKLHAVKHDEVTKDLSVSINISLKGMGSLAIVPLADVATSTMEANWPHPQFIGSTLPSQRNISRDGFDAQWSSSRFSSDAAERLKLCLSGKNCEATLNSAYGVAFIEPVDIYLQTQRAVKYGLLFISLSFITFFIFEQLKKIRIHPIQYTMVGLAIAIFYLLLISLAEHMAFHWAYAIAVLSCSLLLMFYVRSMLNRLSTALLFTSMIVMLYSLLFVIIRAEDFALLMGSVLVFAVLASVMYITRNIDWYGLNRE